MRHARVMDLVDPANPPSRKAPLMWAVGAAIPWVVPVIGQLAWFALDRRLIWLQVVAAAVTVFGIVVFVVVVPVWRYRVHRWEISPQAVFTRTGWLVQERRIAPISRVQTVDTYRGPLDRLFGLANVTVTTASSAGRCTSWRSTPTWPTGCRAADRHCGARRRGRNVTRWQRLSPRMLLVHPVHEVLRQLPVSDRVAGSGLGDRQSVWPLGALALVVGFGVAGGSSPLPARSRRGADAQGSAAARGSFGAAQQDSFGANRRPAAAPAAGADGACGSVPGRRPRAEQFSLDAVRPSRCRGCGRSCWPMPVAPAATRRCRRRVLARWRPSWLRYSPLSFSGLVMIAAVAGMAYQAGVGAALEDSRFARSGSMRPTVSAWPRVRRGRSWCVSRPQCCRCSGRG